MAARDVPVSKGWYSYTKLTPHLWEWSIPTAIVKAACLLPSYNIINLEDFEDYDQKKKKKNYGEGGKAIIKLK